MSGAKQYSLSDLDGCRIEVESYTDVLEETVFFRVGAGRG